MDDSQRNTEIDKIAKMMARDGISYNEQDASKLDPYRDQVKADCGVDDKEAMETVYATLLFMKMKNSGLIDLLGKGKEFGAGFS